MLIAILIVVIVLLMVLLAVMTGLNLTNVKRCEAQYENSKHWFTKFMEQQEAYRALEVGRDEESDSYEQQFLSFQEMIHNQSNAIDSYIEDLHFLVGIVRTHLDDCLPVVAGDASQRERFIGIEQAVLLSDV